LNVLYRARPRPWVLDIMVACGEHLLGGQKAGLRGGAAWETINGKMLCGFSHGAAGIAFALHQLADRTGDVRYRKAAREAEQYENALFSEENENWPDLLAEGTRSPKFRNAWCHGAPGIVLGRLHRVEAEGLDHFIDAGVRTVENEPLGPLDHLCCGNVGRAEVLLEAGNRLGRPELVLKAQKLTAGTVTRAWHTGDYRLGIPDGLELASFHQGLAGIGYHLLRLATPDLIPCVLSWS
jgi:lantibiotic modifying enzyme